MYLYISGRDFLNLKKKYFARSHLLVYLLSTFTLRLKCFENTPHGPLNLFRRWQKLRSFEMSRLLQLQMANVRLS